MVDRADSSSTLLRRIWTQWEEALENMEKMRNFFWLHDTCVLCKSYSSKNKKKAEDHSCPTDCTNGLVLIKGSQLEEINLLFGMSSGVTAQHWTTVLYFWVISQDLKYWFPCKNLNKDTFTWSWLKILYCKINWVDFWWQKMQINAVGNLRPSHFWVTQNIKLDLYSTTHCSDCIMTFMFPGRVVYVHRHF